MNLNTFKVNLEHYLKFFIDPKVIRWGFQKKDWVYIITKTPIWPSDLFRSFFSSSFKKLMEPIEFF